MKRIIHLILVSTFLFLLASCSLSTIDPDQCTDRGWTEIGGYMRQFEELIGTLGEGTSFEAYIDQLTELKDNVEDVSVDACSETCKQKIVSGLEHKITGMQLSQEIENEEVAGSTYQTGMDLIWEALAELEELGIYVDYP